MIESSRADQGESYLFRWNVTWLWDSLHDVCLYNLNVLLLRQLVLCCKVFMMNWSIGALEYFDIKSGNRSRRAPFFFFRGGQLVVCSFSLLAALECAFHSMLRALCVFYQT